MRLNPGRLSLRSRFMLWQLAVLAPLLLATLLHQHYLMPKFMEPLREIAEEIVGEVSQAKSLQLTLHMAAMPVNDYLIHGNQGEIADFANRRRLVDKEFATTLSAPFAESHEHYLVESAWREWEQAKELADELLDTTMPVGLPDMGEKMERFDGHINEASARLEELYKIAYAEIKEAQQEAHRAHTESGWLSSLSLVLALLLSLLLGSALAHTIIHSLTSLRTSASQVATGRYDQEVRAGSIHELEDLAAAFNTMATQLQAHDAMLQELAIHDALTGLENRRALDSFLQTELQRAQRYGHPLGLLMLDIDHFKQVNDTYGHPAGDTVLRELASLIRDTLRPVDKAFRYGGEEFMVVVPETTVAGTHALAERIRETVAAASFPIPCEKTIHITISAGVSTYPQGSDTPETLIAEADKALYQAKRHGRNQVCTHSPNLK